MTREEAIALLDPATRDKELKKYGDTCFKSEALSEAVDIVLNLLNDKLKSKNKGCKYCFGDSEGYTVVIRGWKHPGRMYIPDGKSEIVISGNYNHRAKIEINYCPFCGRYLKKENQKK